MTITLGILFTIMCVLMLYNLYLKYNIQTNSEYIESVRLTNQDLYRLWSVRDDVQKEKLKPKCKKSEKPVKNKNTFNLSYSGNSSIGSFSSKTSSCKSSGPHFHDCDPFTGLDMYGESYSGDW